MDSGRSFILIRYAAAAVLVFIPLIWGAVMVPVLDYLEKKIIYYLEKKNYHE